MSQTTIPTAPLTVQQYVAVIQQSGLVTKEDLVVAIRELQATKSNEPMSANRLGQFLVQKQLLTDWHHQLLVRGRWKGFQILRYRLLRPLGSGGVSVVFLAEHQAMKRRVALKVLTSSSAQNSSHVERFLREGQVLARLSHPHIVGLHDLGQADQRNYMALEFIPGRDLHEVVAKQGPLPVALVVDWMLQLSEALEHVHDANLVHRDLKPANVIVHDRGQIKLTDFGLVLDRNEPPVAAQAAPEMLGTVDYLAPEQAAHCDRVDHRADLYSLGCTIYFLLTGQPPFPTGTVVQRLMQHQSEEPASLLSLRKDIPAELAELCHSLLAKDPAARPASAHCVIEKLQALRMRLSPSEWAAAQKATPDNGSSINLVDPTSIFTEPASPSSVLTGRTKILG